MRVQRLQAGALFTLVTMLAVTGGRPALAAPDGDTYAVIVGVSGYEHVPSLRFAHRDAEAFAAFLRSPAGGAARSSNVIVLANDARGRVPSGAAAATVQSVLKALRWVRERAKENDRVYFFFSGHGDEGTDRKPYFLTNEADPPDYLGNALPMEQVTDALSKVRARTVLTFLDACFSGRATGVKSGGYSEKTMTVVTRMAERGGRAVFTSCLPNEKSKENAKWGGGHGAFTYFLLQGLEGAADKDRNGVVSAIEAHDYAHDHVREAANHRPQMKPSPNGFDNDLTLASGRRRAPPTRRTPALRASLNIDPERVACGDTAEAVIRVWNPGTGDLPGVKVSCLLPAGWRRVGGDDLSWSGSLPMGGSAATARTLRCRIVAPNSPRRFTCTMTARAGALSASDSDTVSVFGPQLSISMQCSSAPKFRNEQGTATITITNTSDAAANNVMVTDQLIVGRADMMSATMDGRDLGTSGNWSIGTLGPRETKVINMTFMLRSVGTISNQARVMADCFGGAQDSCSWMTLAPPAMQQDITDRLGGDSGENNFPVGQEFNYLITLENEGDLPLQVVQTITFPSEIDLVGEKAFVVAGPGSTQALQGLTMRSVGGRKYEIVFPGLLKERASGNSARKAFIMILARGRVRTANRPATVSTSVVWTAFDSTGNTNLGVSGEEILNETTWIGYGPGAPPHLEASLSNRLGGDSDAENFAVGQGFNYLVTLENESVHPLEVKMEMTFPPQIDLDTSRPVAVVFNAGSAQPLQELQIRALGRRKYVIVFPNKLKWRAAGAPARKAFIMVPAKGNTESSNRAFMVTVRLTWTAFDATCSRNLGKGGEVTFAETTWIGTR